MKKETISWVVLSDISPINYNMIDNYWAFGFSSFFKFFYKRSLVHIPSVLRACMHAILLQLCPTLCDPMDCSLPDSSVHGMDSPGKHTGVGCHALLQGIFPTQGAYPSLLGLLHHRQVLYHWATREAYNKTIMKYNLHTSVCVQTHTSRGYKIYISPCVIVNTTKPLPVSCFSK